MIVVCTGCSAKFKVADAKVGPQGAKLRCSRCQTVFMVHREEVVEPTPPPVPLAGPPPLPRRASTAASLPAAAPAAPSSEVGVPVDARAAFEIDLEVRTPRARELARPAPPPDPFGPPPTSEYLFNPPSPGPALPPRDDPFGPPSHRAGVGGQAPPPSEDPFQTALDPFAAVQAPVPEDLLRAPPAPLEPEEDPFAAPLPSPLGDAGDLTLEERSAPAPRPRSSAPMGDPFGGPDEGELGFGGGSPGDIPPLTNDLPGEPFGGFDPLPAATPAPRLEAPLREDPFAAAAVDADPLVVSGPPPRGEPRPAAAPAGRAAGQPDALAPAAEDPPAEGERPPRRPGRLRAAAVSALSLAVLLLVALALLVVWRGGVPLSEAFHPSAVLAALTHRDRAGPFAAERVTSGLYERHRGAPLLFVRGEVLSRAAGPVGAVRVLVSVVKDGQVVGGAEGLAGAVPTAEELHQAADEAAVAGLAALARARAPSLVRPGDRVPFLLVMDGPAAAAAGASLRLEVRAEDAR
ncbi:MAG: zinc-ribbon domain-containing protein [Anaeromyxobacter sp.]|nr:zinc-ribbon domain-containing protein [Anaeromyxobacter sp.]MBL0277394.1 zinc-ribbon domain-containing protein [Anaeromyxobacter sp.]